MLSADTAAVALPCPVPLAPAPAARVGPAPEASWTYELTGGGSCEFLARAADVEADAWEEFLPAGWKDRRYYQTLEETLPEFVHRYAVLRDRAGRALGVQPMFFVEQDLTVSLPAAARRAVAWLRRRRPRLLRMRLLMVGCVVGEGALGVPTGDPAAVRALDEALRAFARREGVGLILFKDLPAALRPGLDGLARSGGWSRIPSLPGVRLDLDFANFDEFLRTRLSKATRKDLRRKFARTGRATAEEPLTMEVKHRLDAGEAAELHALYERVARRGDVQFEVFTAEYFRLLGERMPEHARYFVWRHAGRAVAFSFGMVEGDTFHDNDLGLADDTIARALNLYHVTFRDIIEWAVASGLRRYRSAPFNYEPKRRLRMSLAPLDLYVRHVSAPANFALRRLAPLLAPTRQEPRLREFPNHAEL